MRNVTDEIADWTITDHTDNLLHGREAIDGHGAIQPWKSKSVCVPILTIKHNVEHGTQPRSKQERVYYEYEIIKDGRQAGRFLGAYLATDYGHA